MLFFPNTYTQNNFYHSPSRYSKCLPLSLVAIHSQHTFSQDLNCFVTRHPLFQKLNGAWIFQFKSARFNICQQFLCRNFGRISNRNRSFYFITFYRNFATRWLKPIPKCAIFFIIKCSLWFKFYIFATFYGYYIFKIYFGIRRIWLTGTETIMT